MPEHAHETARSLLRMHTCIYILCSFLATTLRKAEIEPMPSVYDVKRVVTEHCILPMGIVTHVLVFDPTIPNSSLICITLRHTFPGNIIL